MRHDRERVAPPGKYPVGPARISTLQPISDLPPLRVPSFLFKARGKLAETSTKFAKTRERSEAETLKKRNPATFCMAVLLECAIFAALQPSKISLHCCRSNPGWARGGSRDDVQGILLPSQANGTISSSVVYGVKT